MRNIIAFVGLGLVLGLSVALLAYQFVPVPPPPVLDVTCYSEGATNSIEANNAVLMTGRGYAELTVLREADRAIVRNDQPRFCSFTVN